MSDHYCKRCGQRYDDCNCQPTMTDPTAAPQGDDRAAMSRLMQLAADCAQRKPLRALEHLSGVSHIGHRQFGLAYDQADDAIRQLAVDLRGVFDDLAAERAKSEQVRVEIGHLRHELRRSVALAEARLVQMNADRAQALRWRDELHSLRGAR